MLDLLRRLGVSTGVAVAATLLFVLSPASILYENWLFYSYPLAACLLFAAWAFCRFAGDPTCRWAAVALALVAVPALTWSLFHVAWVVLVVALIAIALPRGRKTLAVAAVVPLVIVSGWYVKNLVFFGEPVASTWFGQSLSRVATGGMDREQRARLAAELGVSGIVGISTFSPLDDYRDYISMPEPTGIRVLDEERKSDGTPNFNHLAYITVSHRYFEAALDILRQRPDLYVRAVARGFCRFVLPATDYEFLERNRDQIRWADRVYNAVVFGQLRTPPFDSGCTIRRPLYFPFFMPLLFFGSIAAAAALAYRRSERPQVRVTMAFIGLTMAWVMIVGDLAEFGENNRFRFVTLPMMLVTLGVVTDRALASRSRWQRRV
jgi:hypothetical protein